jgi:hypothetical protein
MDRTRLSDSHVTICLRNVRLSEAQTSARLRFVTRCHIHNSLKANAPIHIKVADRDEE